MVELQTRIAQKARRGVGRTRATGESIPPAVLGWNARDPLFEMKPGFATILDNFFPQTGFTEVRRGFNQFSSGVGSGAVESLFSFRSELNNNLIACGSGNIYNVPGATPVQIGTGFTNNRWQGVNFNRRLILVNGDDDPQSWDGTTLSNANFTGPTTPSDLINVAVWKRRLIFAEKTSASFWYAPVENITGALAEFNLGTWHPGGGDLLAIGTVSADAGDGPDDYLALFMQSGDVIIYAGTDPGDFNAFAVVGVYNIGKVIGRKPLIKLGSDLIAITENGFIPVKPFLQRGRSRTDLAISDNISGAVRDATRDFGDNLGWEAVFYPRGTWLLFNVPLVQDQQAVQYVMNTQTGAWCRFTNMAAASWVVHDDNIYFGNTGGRVMQADNTRNDNGAAIPWDAQSAYIYFGGRGLLKQFQLFRPVISSDSVINVSMGLGVDFVDEVPVAQLSTPADEGSEWDVAEWDVAFWVGGLSIQQEWRSAANEGYAAAIRIRGQTSGQEVRWFATDILYERGGFL